MDRPQGQGPAGILPERCRCTCAPHDRLAGSISELPGAMPVMVELGIAENNIYTGENPKRQGYLKGQVPEEIRDYWKNRNLWGLLPHRDSRPAAGAEPR